MKETQPLFITFSLFFLSIVFIKPITVLEFPFRGLGGRRYLGGYSDRVPPLPIPNREVKPVYVDGTAAKWESR